MTPKTQKLIKQREEIRSKLVYAPLVGDYIKYPDGTYKRFTHDWGPDHGIQVASYFGNGDSFYLQSNGIASYSGGLDPAIPYSKLKLIDETKQGSFWVFQDDLHMAHNGINFMLDCKVWLYLETVIIYDSNDAAGFIDLMDQDGKTYVEILEVMKEYDYSRCPHTLAMLPELIAELMGDEE